MRFIIIQIRQVSIFLELMVLLAFSLVIQPMSAQDQVPTETPTETVVPTQTDSPTQTPFPTIAPTPSPSEIPTDTAVPIQTPIDTPTDAATATDTTISTETATEVGSQTEAASLTSTSTTEAQTITASASATSSMPTETATASATQPAFTPEPPLTLLFTDTFDTGSLILWNIATGWSLTSHDSGQAIQAVNSDEPVTFIHNSLNNAVVETHFAMSAGMVRLSLRQSEAGAYSAILAMNGQIALYRGDQVIGTAVVSPITAGTWHTLRLSVINNTLRLSVDNTQGIVTEDTTPLPPGTFSFAGVGNTNSTLLVDDVSLWMPTSELQATSTPTFTVTPSATVTGEAPEPALRLIYNQSFDGSSDPFGELSRSIWPLKRVEPDYALYVTGAKRLTRVTHQSYTDVVSEARFFVSNGAGQLSIRQNGTVGYTASLNANGQIELYRNSTLIDSVPVGTPVVGQWYAIRLTAIADLVRVYVNNAEFIRFTDSSPLPDGMITFNGENLGNQPLLVDDLQVWVPDETLLTAQRLAPQSQALLSAAEPSIWDYLKRNEIFISGFLYYMSYGTGNGEGGSISLTDSPGLYVALSPDGHQIAYNCSSDSSDICVMNVDGSGYFRVTDDLDYDNHPSWSPDGSQISFWSSREIDGVLTSGIWTINADGTNLQLLATSSQGYEPRWVGTTINNGIYYFVYGEGFYRYDPATESNQLVATETGEGVGKSDYAVSRSGDYWLAYTRSELLVPEWYDQSILIVRNLSQGANEIVYRNTDGCYYAHDIYHPILSPDATYVTYFTDQSGGGPDGCGPTGSKQWAIAVNDLSSGTPVFVQYDSVSAGGESGDWGYRSDPNPIPVTGKLAYVRTGSTGKDVWIMENWTDQQTQLSDSPFADTNPELSPGGQYVAFVTDRFGGGKEIVVKPVADGLSDEHLLRLTDNYEITDDSPTWSPNGQQIAFYSENPTSYGINVMNADGSSKQLVFAGSNITDLSWSPVENELVYTGYDNYTDSYGIYTLDINNPVPVLLTSDPANERHPVWSPDGEQIAFTANTDGRYNIYVMDANGSNVQGVSTNNQDGDHVYPAWSPDGSQLAFTSFSPEFNTNPYYDYSTTQTVLQIYQRDTLQASSEMSLSVLSNSAVPLLMQSTSAAWLPLSFYAIGDFSETTWRGFAQVQPTPTPTPTATQTPCQANLRNPISPPYTTINLWDRPGEAVIDQLSAGTPVYLLNGVQRASWWWHVILVNDPNAEGYVNESVVNDNNCTKTVAEPPPPPSPQPNEQCFVNLAGASAEVKDGSGQNHQAATILRTITAPSENIRVYGTSYDRSLLLISSPGIWPQEWAAKSLFTPNPPKARACLNSVLGRFKRESTRQEYWAAVGAYANNFQAPVLYNTDYAVYRNSYSYIPSQHEGTDLVYRYPDGTGDSIPFEVHAQANGVIVDAGPDGITRAYKLEKTFVGATQAPPNQFGGRSGVFYWAEPVSDGWKVTYFVAQTGDRDNDPSNDKPEKPNTDYYPFGLDSTSLQNLRLNGFVDVCNGTYGCIDGPGRRIIIWYESANDENGQPNRPEIQSVYYHVSVDELPQYQQLKSICSDNRNTTWTKTIIENDSAYTVCKISTGSFLGTARMIGFSTAPHLHYEVYVDRANDGGFDEPKPADDREDVLMAFATIR